MTTTSYRDHAVIGTPDQLANLLANHTTAGTLLGVSAPQPRDNGRYAIVVRLADRTATGAVVPARPTPAPPHAPGRRPTTPRPATRTPTAEVDYKLIIRIRSARTQRRRRLILIVAVALTLAAALAYAVGYLISRLTVLTVDLPTLLGLAGVLLLIAAALSGGPPSRRHCPGCD
jgi:hypothetical protein